MDAGCGSTRDRAGTQWLFRWIPHTHWRAAVLHHCAQNLRLAAVVVFLVPIVAGAQTLPSTPPASPPVMLVDRGPTFYAVTATGRLEPLDASHTLALTRRIGLHLDHASAAAALIAISARTGLRFTYDPAVLPLDASVSLHADDITVAAALTQVLLDAKVDVELESADLASIRPAHHPSTAQQRTGAIIGRVVDAKTQLGIRFATVAVENTHFGATTGDSGQYRITGMPLGTYTVVARLVGYIPARKGVTVDSAAPVTADFTLEKSPNQLELVVTTGTLVPTEIKAIPTPITVISASTITDQQPWSITQIIRQAVPTAVSFDNPINPALTNTSTRGASTLNTPDGTMKTYIDGIETAEVNSSAVDPSSIDHVEVIRGPEAATLYGADAIGGVIQIFTKRGGSSDAHPEIDAQTALGTIESPYRGYSGALRQSYSASVQGGGPAAAYGVGGSYTHNSPWVPQGQVGTPSLWGGLHTTQGGLSIDVSARYYDIRTPETASPELAKTGFAPLLPPFYDDYDSRNQTYGGRVTYTTTPWWRQTVTAGVDQFSYDNHQTHPHLATPADTFLVVGDLSDVKTSIAYNSAFDTHLGSRLALTSVIGIDHYGRDEATDGTSGATTTINSIQSPGGPPTIARYVVTNTGFFDQEQLAWLDALFVTVGIRADQNSSFGSGIGTPISQRFGVSYVQGIGNNSIKARASFGEAIHPPDPYLAVAQNTPPFIQLANPLLGPERQREWDAGIDWFFGTRGSLGVTYYDQLATDLIVNVPLDTTGLVSQEQNIGRVRNWGSRSKAPSLSGSSRLAANTRTATRGWNHSAPTTRAISASASSRSRSHTAPPVVPSASRQLDIRTSPPALSTSVR